MIQYAASMVSIAFALAACILATRTTRRAKRAIREYDEATAEFVRLIKALKGANDERT